MNGARPDLPSSVTVKSLAPGLMFPTMPVGVPSVPAGLDNAGGTVTKFVVPPLATTG
jgi:hypothetical protein